MAHHHHFRTIAQNDLGYVGICSSCGILNVAFQNSLFCLTLDQFKAFAEIMHDRLDMRPFCTTHGKELLLTTPMPNYFLLFTEDELDLFCELLTEVAPVLEAERILALGSMN
ncbi:hypothetical protein GO755_16915 [Spirosoma sp. HMF4905]|uniref:Uncharacterized protein n=1 Tax=Spirosoma arboris TaxID=2682092 RepID=A0A7K1SD38_9BACT|nr:DUF6686 family protein [Spirosoma arboris]MVM31732.1 hypothetical protein [Spirosoma arboris]